MASSSSRSSKKACTEINNIIQVVTCLVDECSSDLSNCRKYYQRHKVCEIHSKSPQVSIDGQKLRFCQQCSRFHSLDEFDEGKRSCRKRLDGHNKRRRKPRPNLFPSNHGLVSGTSMLQFGLAPTWLDHSNHAPSLLSSSVAPTQTYVSTVSRVVQPPFDSSGLVSITASSLDHGLSYGGLENDCDVSWCGMTDVDNHHHASFDHEDLQTLPFNLQSK